MTVGQWRVVEAWRPRVRLPNDNNIDVAAVGGGMQAQRMVHVDIFPKTWPVFSCLVI